MFEITETKSVKAKELRIDLQTGRRWIYCSDGSIRNDSNLGKLSDDTLSKYVTQIVADLHSGGFVADKSAGLADFVKLCKETVIAKEADEITKS